VRAILTFHSVDSSGSVLSISPDQLRSLLAAIQRSGHRIVPLRELLDDPVDPGRIALTFDDGFHSVHRHGLPVLEEAGASATLFLTTGWAGSESQRPSLPARAPMFPMLSWSEVEVLHESGWAIESHTPTHPNLRACSNEEIASEYAQADDAIASHLGRRPEILAYPYGYFDGRVEAQTRHCYRFALTTQMSTLGSRVEAPHRVPRLDAYYLRATALHRGFGGGACQGYLAARAWLRGLRER
jgi:peptidoglycan/xylan/chitin deacetylase (PgdA/CDA1 family)